MSPFFRISPVLLFLLMEPTAAASFDDLLKEGETYRQRGQYYLAAETLAMATEQAHTPAQKARSAGALGQTYYFMHQPEAAETLLRHASEADVLRASERSHYNNVLGSLYASQNRYDLAARYYTQALSQAGPDRVLVLNVKLNRARLAPPQQRLTLLKNLLPEIAALPKSTEQARLYLNVGEQASRLGQPALSLAYQALTDARTTADQQRLLRLSTESLLALGRLYEEQGLIGDALNLNQIALQQSQTRQDHDLLFELEWQQGRLLRRQQHLAAALNAYRRALEHLETIRFDMPVEYHDGRSSFRETLAPVYLGLADLLLREARQINTSEAQTLLHEARDTVELIKQTELEDFLGDRCSIASARHSNLQAIAANTAVLYPVILPDRLELLLDLDGTIRQFTVPVSGKRLQAESTTLANHLRNDSARFREPARRLYDWLIAPLEPILRQHAIQTLVTVPDGPLRLIPMAALYDGEHFLIERYALAVSPALTLLTSQAYKKKKPKMLLAGLSEPGPVVTKLPWSLLKNIFGSNREFTATDRGYSSHTRSFRAAASSLPDELTRRDLLNNPKLQARLIELLKLPGVKQEIEHLHEQTDNTLLFNDTFTLEDFTKQLRGETYPFIHIASHGVFGHSAETTFIMAFDDLIRIDDLESMLQSTSRREATVELITLSACQTAEGDDRAPLGLSGVALRAHARSAVGTLWPISDEAAQSLMVNFYRALTESDVGKAEALRRAQLELLKNPEMNAPFYWSPFILVGDWS